MNSPSYPSGHSVQGIMIAKVLQTKLSIKTDAFLAAGKRISYSRNIGRAHYPSDSRLGEDIGDAMFKYLRDKI
jgi:membrane-associated phospholipid phosphatase